MTQIEKIKAEVERLKTEVANGKTIVNGYSYLLSFIESLEKEGPQGLDEAAEKTYPKMSRVSEPHDVIPADNESHLLGDANEEKRECFKFGAKWMAEQIPDEEIYGERELDEIAKRKSIEWQKANNPMCIAGGAFSDMEDSFNFNPAYFAGFKEGYYLAKHKED